MKIRKGGVNVSVYKTSATSQLMPQHSTPAKRTYARGRKKIIPFSCIPGREEWEESDK